MGSKAKGFVLINDEGDEYTADILEPSKEQMLKFLASEKRRIDNRLQEGLVPQNTEEMDEDAATIEEADYQRAMKILSKLHESPGVIACCIIMTGTGSSTFYSPNLEKREKCIALLRRTLAKAIDISCAEISIGKIKDTTAGALSECCDVEVGSMPFDASPPPLFQMMVNH